MSPFEAVRGIKMDKDMVFNQMYKHLTGNYQANFKVWCEIWSFRNIPNYFHLINQFRGD